MPKHVLRHGIVAVIILIHTLPPWAFGQEGARVDPSRENSLHGGAWAIQFQIGENFTLGSFQGTFISLKRHISPSAALRFGVGGAFSADDSNLNVLSTGADTFQYTDSHSNRDYHQEVAINMQYLWYPNPADNVNLFCGSGPVVQYSHSKFESEDGTREPSPSPGSIATRNDVSHLWGLGLSTVIGAEWFATRSISFHAEYGVTLMHFWWEGTTEHDIRSARTRITSIAKKVYWQLNPSSVKFGLSVYL